MATELTENMKLIKPLLNEPMSNWPSQNENNVKTLDATLNVNYGVFSPQWRASSANPTIGDGHIEGRRLFIGDRLVYFWVVILVGNTTTFGSGTYSLTLPVEADMPIGSSFGNVYIASYLRWLNSDIGSLRLKSSTEVEIILARSGVGIWSSSNVTNRILEGPGDVLHVTGCYTRAVE